MGELGHQLLEQDAGDFLQIHNFSFLQLSSFQLWSVSSAQSVSEWSSFSHKVNFLKLQNPCTLWTCVPPLIYKPNLKLLETWKYVFIFSLNLGMNSPFPRSKWQFFYVQGIKSPGKDVSISDTSPFTPILPLCFWSTLATKVNHPPIAISLHVSCLTTQSRNCL